MELIAVFGITSFLVSFATQVFKWLSVKVGDQPARLWLQGLCVLISIGASLVYLGVSGELVITFKAVVLNAGVVFGLANAWYNVLIKRLPFLQ